MKKILIVGDSAYLNTGYGVVCKNIGNSLHDAGHKVNQLALFQFAAKNKSEDVKFNIRSASIPRSNNKHEKHGLLDFDNCIMEFTPDIVISIGDVWDLSYIHLSKFRKSFYWISYFPVDGEPFPTTMPYGNSIINSKDMANYPDANVAFTLFGRNTLQKAGIRVEHVINHGVNTEVYHPVSKEEALSFRKKFFSKYIHEDKIESAKIFLFVGRNQYRKYLPSLLEAWKEYLDSKDKNTENTYLYFHTPYDDIVRGYNLYEIMEDLQIDKSTVILNSSLEQGSGLLEEEMNLMYNSCDYFISGTTGEGWGLPILEAIAVGIPTAVTRYSGHLEFASGISSLIEVKTFVYELASSIKRAIINEKHLAQIMLGFLTFDDEKLNIIKNQSLEIAKRYDWKEVNKDWVRLIESIEVKDKSDILKECLSLRPQDSLIQNGDSLMIYTNPIDDMINPKRSKKIGFMTTYNQKCGIATYSKNLKDSIELICEEPTITIFSELKEYNILLSQIIKSNIEILHIQHEPGIIYSDIRLRNFITSLKSARKNLKVFITLHLEHQGIISAVDGVVDGIIVHSSESASYAVASKLIRINHPIVEYDIDKKFIEKHRRDIGANNKFIIGFNGFMVPQKQLDSFLAIVSGFIKENKNIFIYYLNAVRDNDVVSNNILQNINRIVKSNNIEDRVYVDTTFHSKEDMAKRISCFDIGVCFTGHDTMSQSGSIAEVVGNRVPVIASNVSHFRHILSRGMGIGINDEGNIEKFASTVVQLVSSVEGSSILNKCINNIDTGISDMSYTSFAKSHLGLYNA